MRRVVLAVLVLAAWSGPALANGNYSHTWVAVDAVRFVPPGEMRDLLGREGMIDVLRNGAMYPDGGYAIGSPHAEVSHWEPFHKVYQEWIRKTWPKPWSDEAARHVVFLMGMTAHGLTDQMFDGMYLQRHEHFDPDNGEAPFGLDGATDSCFAATQGVVDLPEPWVPVYDLAPLYLELGLQVDVETIEHGHALVPFAIAHANDEATKPATIESLKGFYPWACGHQDDPGVPGSPVTSGRAVAAYWAVLWDRLNGQDGFDPPPVATYFTGGSPWETPRDHASPDSWVSFVAPRGLDPTSVNDGSVVVTRDGGGAHPVDLQVYYGWNSHLVNIKPREDWAEDADYTVTISAPLRSWDQFTLAGKMTFTFSTKPAPPLPDTGPEAVEAAEVAEPIPEVVEEAVAEDVATPDAGIADGTGDVDAPDVPVVADVPTVTDLPADIDAGNGSSSGCAAGSGPAPATSLLLPLLLLAVLGRRFLAIAGGRGFLHVPGGRGLWPR